jgi:Flp pilus assembly protein TadG
MNLSETPGAAGLPAAAFIRRFGNARDGFAAMEFALIAPVLISIYFAVTELSDGYMASTKVTQVASTAADLTAQESSVCNAEMTDVFSALSAIMFPYPSNNMQIRISSLVDTGNGTLKVAWSDAQNTTPRSVNEVVPVPTGLVTSGSGDSLILAEVTYDYSSPAGHLLYGTRQFSDRFYLNPRRALQIARTAGC